MAEYVSPRDQSAMLLSISVPNAQQAFGLQLADLQRLVWNNEREPRTLGRLRDALPPQLISGELSVAHAKATV